MSDVDVTCTHFTRMWSFNPRTMSHIVTALRPAEALAFSLPLLRAEKFALPEPRVSLRGNQSEIAVNAAPQLWPEVF